MLKYDNKTSYNYTARNGAMPPKTSISYIPPHRHAIAQLLASAQIASQHEVIIGVPRPPVIYPSVTSMIDVYFSYADFG